MLQLMSLRKVVDLVEVDLVGVDVVGVDVMGS